MATQLTLEYWDDDGWCVGRLKEVPGIFSQGETLPQLQDNIRDAYRLMLEDEAGPPVPKVQTKQIEIPA